MNIVADLTLSALRNTGIDNLGSYSQSLISACDKHQPPFGMAWYGDQYRGYAKDPHWLAFSLVANAEVEGDGARKLWKIAGYAEQKSQSELVKQHAVDEARHARLYIHMLRRVFPGAMDRELENAAKAMSPTISMRDILPESTPAPKMRLLDDLIQMNIGEIRTRIHQQLLRPVILAHCPLAERATIAHALEALLADETRHIAYTAELIEQHSQSGHDEFVRLTMEKRLAQFNEITLNEVGALIFDGE
jgi:hypothetical protein